MRASNLLFCKLRDRDQVSRGVPDGELGRSIERLVDRYDHGDVSHGSGLRKETGHPYHEAVWMLTLTIDQLRTEFAG